MYFTECARLVERRPELATAVRQVDAQLQKMRTAEVIRTGDLASFLGMDPHPVNAVLEELAREKLLLAEEMVECAHCGMAVLRAEYEEMREEGDYRCTSCDRSLTDMTVQTVTTYRRGEKWRQVSHPGDPDGPSARVPSNITLDEQAWYTHDRLAEIFNLSKDALRKRLDRFREHNANGWKLNEDRRPREPKYLYRVKDVRDIIKELQASSQRPAK